MNHFIISQTPQTGKSLNFDLEDPLTHSPDMGIFGVKKQTTVPSLQNKKLIDKSKITITACPATKSHKKKGKTEPEAVEAKTDVLPEKV